MFHVEQYKMFHVEQCKINVTRGTMHKGSSLGGRGQRRASAAAFRSSRRCFGFFGLRRQLSAPVGAASASSGSATASIRYKQPPPPSAASATASLRYKQPPPPSAASATASLRYKQPPPPSAAFATASLRFKQPPPPLLKPPRGLAPMLPPPADCPDC